MAGHHHRMATQEQAAPQVLEYFTLKQVEHVRHVLRTTWSLLDSKKLTYMCNVLNYYTVHG